MKGRLGLWRWVASFALVSIGAGVAEDFVYVRATTPGETSEIHWFPASAPQSARVLVEDLDFSNFLYRHRDELWWWSGQQIRRGNLVGQEVMRVPDLRATNIARQGDSVYWGSFSQIRVYQLSTGESEVLLNGSSVGGLVLYEDRLYFGNGSYLETIRLDGSGRRKVRVRITSFGRGQAFAVHDGKLTWVQENQLWEVDLKTEEASLLNANLPETLRAVAATDDALYWISRRQPMSATSGEPTDTVWRWMRGSEVHEPLYQIGATRFSSIVVVSATPVGSRMDDKEEVSVAGEAGEFYQLLHSPDLSLWAPDYVERSLFTENGVLQWLNPLSLDTDGPVVWRPKLSDRQAYFTAWRYDLEPPFDADRDQLPDYWERRHFGDLSAEPEDDSNGDGLTHLEEARRFIGPVLLDSDGDGLTDLEESAFDPPLNPAEIDTDGDTLTDGEEVNVYKSDPTLADSDSDGFRDDFEVSFESDPNDSGDAPQRERVLAFFAEDLMVHFDFEAAEDLRVPNLGILGGHGRVIGEEVYVTREARSGSLSKAIQFLNPDHTLAVASFIETDFSMAQMGLTLDEVEFSIGIWLRPEGPTNGTYLSVTGADGVAPSIEFTLGELIELPDKHSLRYELRDERSNTSFNRDQVGLGVWTHVLLSMGPNGVRIHIDGESGSEVLGIPSFRFEDDPILWLGAQRGLLSATRSFRGSIDDVKIYRRQLPDGAVKLLVD